MTAPTKVFRWFLIALWAFPNVLPANTADLPTWEFNPETVTEFDIRDELATPLIRAFESSTGQAMNSMSGRMTGAVSASGNWAVFTGDISTSPDTESKTVPLAVLFLKSGSAWLVVDFAGGEKFKHISHWPATFHMPDGLLDQSSAPQVDTKPVVIVAEPASSIDKSTTTTPSQNPAPVASEPTQTPDEDAFAALRTEFEQLQQEYATLQNQQKDLPSLRDPISDAEIARNVKKFDAMGDDFSSLKDAYLESVERERKNHHLANDLRKAIDTTKARLDEIADELQRSEQE